MSKDKAKIKSNSERIHDRKVRVKALKLGLLISAIFLIIIYCILRIIYTNGAFTVVMDQAFSKKSGIVIYENPEQKESKRILSAGKMGTMDNISINWLPNNLNDGPSGSHNGDNYIAYTFYIENKGIETFHYWYNISIDDVVRNVDEAIRVMVYRNEEKVIYAKQDKNGVPEKDTVPFYSDEYVLLNQRQNFNVGDIDKYTIVIWVEGDDSDCTDELIGGAMKMHMEFIEEQNIT